MIDPADTPRLIEYLRTTDAPCPACGYNLRAIPQIRCPECGRPYRTQDIGVQPRHPALIFIASGRAWLLCALLLTILYTAETSLLHPVPDWYAIPIRSEHGVPAIPGSAAALLVAWLIMRPRSRHTAEPALKLAWGLLGLYVLAVLLLIAAKLV